MQNLVFRSLVIKSLVIKSLVIKSLVIKSPVIKSLVIKKLTRSRGSWWPSSGSTTASGPISANSLLRRAFHCVAGREIVSSHH